MAIKRQRAPRPGEVLNWLSLRKYRATPEEGKSGPQVRVSPTPCCGREKHGNCITINTATGLWCCFKCGKKGNWFGFTRIAGEPISDPYEDAAPVDFSVYERIRARLRRAVTGGHHPALLAYAESRGFTRATLDAWKVSTCGPEALRWPLFAKDETGLWQIANARVRRVIDRDDTSKGPGDWFEVKGGPINLAIGNHLLGTVPPTAEGRPWLVDWLSPDMSAPPYESVDPGLQKTTEHRPLKIRRVLLVEGQWDAMTAWQLGIPNVLSLTNGAGGVELSGLLRYVPEDAEVWLAFDMDEAGDRAAEAVFAQLGVAVARLRLPEKDLNAWLVKNPGLTAEEVLSLNQQPCDAVRGRMTLSLKTGAETREIIAPTPWPKLTRRLGGGWRASQTTGLLAPSGAGKTTLANVVAIAAIQAQAQVGVIQLESTPKANAEEIVGQAMAWVKPDDPESYLVTLNDRLWFSGLNGKEVTWQQTLVEAEELMRAGCRMVVIDNWDYIVPSDGSGHRDKARAYAAFQELCKAHRAHGFVVWQPHKIDRGEIINSGSQKGLSTALQDADVYMTLNKFGLARRLDVEKVRSVPELAEGDSMIWLRFEAETKLLYESEGQANLAPVKEDGDKF